MNDRELLELAAKATGFEWRYEDDGRMSVFMYDRRWIFWNPLSDDGDALRLSFVAGFKVDIAKREVWYCKTPTLGKWLSLGWDGGIEGLRRAIVRAAAAIGAAL